MDFTIVTACNKDYLEKLKATLPTWPIKPQFKGKPIIVLYNGIEEKQLEFVKKHFPKYTFINWSMKDVDNTRELMLSSFVYIANKIDTPYYVKIDSETYFTNSRDVFDSRDFTFDIVGHSWGYTKPGYYLDILDNFFFNKNIPINKEQTVRAQHRFASFLCLHKTEFVKEVISKIGDKLPVPSHDTLLWYCAENFKNRTWSSKKLKRFGVGQNSRLKKILLGIKQDTVVPVTVAPIILSETNKLFKNIQLEVITKCNLGCFNCDRNCGIAPSNEEMSVNDVAKFVTESLELDYRWDRIDIIGGEPTLHPELASIVDILKCYKDKYPACIIRISTNGLGNAEKILSSLPSFVKIRNSNKKTKINSFVACNDAPIDHGFNQSIPCNVPYRCGLALTPHGYFSCGVGASICRVFDFKIGINKLKEYSKEKHDKQIDHLCKYCGASITPFRHKTDKPEISASWQTAIDNYNKIKK